MVSAMKENKTDNQKYTEKYDLLIAGAGPAGMTAAIYGARAGLKLLLTEGQFPGGKMVNTETVENWPGTETISGADLAGRMYSHCEALGIPLAFNPVGAIRQTADGFLVPLGPRTVLAATVIVATGTLDRLLDIPGEAEYKGRGISYCAVCDGAFFKDQPTVVIGGGNTAYEDALYLARFASQVDLVLRRDTPRADQANIRAVKENPAITVHYNLTPVAFRGDGNRLTDVIFRVSDGAAERSFKAAGAFPRVGLLPNVAPVSDFAIFDEDGFILTDEQRATAVPGLFAAGDVRHTPLRQIVTAAADGSIAIQSTLRYLESQRR